MLSITVYNIKNIPLLAVGASTSICSVIGFDFAYRILRVNNQPLQARRLLITLLYIFLISMLPGVDFFGHFGSLAAGFLIGGSFLKPSQVYWNANYIVFIRLIGRFMLVIYFGILVYFISKYQKWSHFQNIVFFYYQFYNNNLNNSHISLFYKLIIFHYHNNNCKN
jgi:hypothetical protein